MNATSNRCAALGLALGLVQMACSERAEVGRFSSTTPDAAADAEPTPPEIIPSAARLALGYGSSCAIDGAGKVVCWGSNDIGQLGVGDFDLKGSPSPLPSLGLQAGVRALFSGRSSQCAVLQGGRALCWSGSLFFAVPWSDAGIPVNVYSYLYEPKEVDDLTFVASMGLGHWFHCALNTQGGVKCYGYNSEGQLGNGTLGDSFSPLDVIDLPPSRDLCASEHYACAVTVEGAVRCWGENEDGQLGNGTTEASASPVSVQGVPAGATAVTCGWSHACALVQGEVYCWGHNRFGQLGSGASEEIRGAEPVPGQTQIAQIAAGGWHTCVRSEDGQALCWGREDSGSSQDGPTVMVASGVTELAAGVSHSCALVDGQWLRCWGTNDFGELGPFAGDGAAL